jgi:hypothetical protein
MPRPALLAVDGGPAAKTAIERELRRLYGADYEVACAASGAAALGALEQLGTRRPVAFAATTLASAITLTAGSGSAAVAWFAPVLLLKLLLGHLLPGEAAPRGCR